MLPLVLGSESPRRKEILNHFTLPFIQAPSFFDETSIPFNGDPKQYATTISQHKNEALKPHYPDQIILTADTIVYQEGKIYGKQKTEEEAFAVLSTFSGQWHKVYTGLTISHKGKQFSEAECSHILFNSLTPDHIRAYLKQGAWKDKAGGYGIQINAGLLVNKIFGCYYNVMGLPINTLRTLLQYVNIELWDYIQ